MVSLLERSHMEVKSGPPESERDEGSPLTELKYYSFVVALIFCYFLGLHRTYSEHIPQILLYQLY